MSNKFGTALVFFTGFFSLVSTAQTKQAIPVVVRSNDDSTKKNEKQPYYSNINDQKDLIDVFQVLLNKNAKKRTDEDSAVFRKPHVSVLPAVGYTLQTGFAAVLAANVAFYTSTNRNENVSSVFANVTYSQYQQILFPILTSIWTSDDEYNFVADWRYLKYPSITYGLGSNTSLSDGYTIDYSLIHLNQAVLKKIIPDIYLGIGYRVDHFWNVVEVDPPVGKISDFKNYGLSNTVTASGATLNFLYDDRRNPINPLRGNYLSINYWPNFTFMGSDNDWQSLTVDIRKYIQFPSSTHNVLAFWSYDWFTFGGKPPYLLLPSTGGDPASNSGRGYIQGRYRGNNMLYAEGEYRFVITHNELLGGVLFANAQSLTDQTTNHFDSIIPGYGLGIRLKMNKFSRSNIAIDYGFGTGGSRGFFVNLGEVF